MRTVERRISNQYPTNPSHYSKATIPQLVAYLKTFYHSRVDDQLNRVERLISLNVFQQPESEVLSKIHHLFPQLSEQLRLHVQKENDQIFPLCVALWNHTGFGSFKWRTITWKLEAMQAEHAEELQMLNQLRDLRNQFKESLDIDSSATGYVTAGEKLVQVLERFDAASRAHLRLENEYVYPQAYQIATTEECTKYHCS